MNGNTALIGMIVMLIVTAGGTLVVYEVTDGFRDSARSIKTQHDSAAEQTQDLVLVNIVGTNLTNEGVKYVRMQLRYDGDGELNLNETFIQLRTDTSISDLQYRNGTAVRDVTSGFYTQ